ncbi:hypothetical protein [Amedibacillus sp. YH-ame10]
MMKNLLFLPILCLAFTLATATVTPNGPIVTPYGGGGLVDF